MLPKYEWGKDAMSPVLKKPSLDKEWLQELYLSQSGCTIVLHKPKHLPYAVYTLKAVLTQINAQQAIKFSNTLYTCDPI